LNQLSWRHFPKRLEYHMLPGVTKAIRIHQTGGPEVLKLEDIELPPPGDGEARVRHEAIGVNFIDTYHRSGLYSLPLPAVLGVEAAGVIEDVGAGVALPVGARVAYSQAGAGAYAEARNVRADRLIVLPESVSTELAASALLKGMTAEYLVRRTYTARAGDIALVHAAAGGVGSILVQWLTALGARVIGVVSSAEKAELARVFGCSDVLLSGSGPLAPRVRELTGGRGVHVVYDSVGKATLPDSLECVARRGLVVSFGNASGRPDPIDPLKLAELGSIFFTRPVLADYTKTREELVASADAVFAVLANATVKVSIGSRFALAEAEQAHRALEARQTTGSTLLLPW
jgi:NADPH2:quinone reductase